MFETQKSGNKTGSGKIGLDIRTDASQSQSGTSPGVRRSKRPMLACHTRCKCSIENHFYAFDLSSSYLVWRIIKQDVH